MPRPPKHALAFNDRSLRALKPHGESRVDYMDTSPGMRGFGIMVRPSGTTTFFVRYRVERAERRVTLGDFPTLPLATARELARDVLGRVAVGADPQAGDQQQPAEAMAFGDLAASYLEPHAKRRLRPRSFAEEERVIQHDLLPCWAMPASAIRRRDVAQLLQAIVARGANVQANRTRAVLSRIFSYAVELEILEYNPVVGVRRPRPRNDPASVSSPRTRSACYGPSGRRNPRLPLPISACSC